MTLIVFSSFINRLSDYLFVAGRSLPVSHMHTAAPNLSSSSSQEPKNTYVVYLNITNRYAAFRSGEVEMIYQKVGTEEDGLLGGWGGTFRGTYPAHEQTSPPLTHHFQGRGERTRFHSLPEASEVVSTAGLPIYSDLRQSSSCAPTTTATRTQALGRTAVMLGACVAMIALLVLKRR